MLHVFRIREILVFNFFVVVMGVRQPKFLYGPLLGFFMGLMFSKASGKYQYSAQSAPWYVSEKPAHYNDEEYLSQWHPLEDPYYTITTPVPQGYDVHSGFSSISGFGEETAAASNVNVRRKKPDRYRANAKRRRTNNRPKRRRTTTTTTEAYYYEDDYYSGEFEDYSEEVRTTVRTPLKRRKTTTPAYDDYQDYSIEVTTKSKRRKKPTVSSASVEEDDVEVTTRKLLAQRQTTTGETTTTEAATTNTTGLTTTTFAGYNGTNLHDNITFTYGPPTSNDSNFGPVYTNYGPPALAKLDYAPFWYSSFKSRNDIVKRVQDIVGEEDFLGLSDLQQ